MRDCEIMSKVVCKTGLLKGHDYRLKRKPFGSRMCILCELGIEDNTFHLVMQCPFNATRRNSMYNELNSIDEECIREVLSKPQEVLLCLLGRQPENAPVEAMLKFWEISCKYISMMYRASVAKHKEYITK